MRDKAGRATNCAVSRFARERLIGCLPFFSHARRAALQPFGCTGLVAGMAGFHCFSLLLTLWRTEELPGCTPGKPETPNQHHLGGLSRNFLGSWSLHFSLLSWLSLHSVRGTARVLPLRTRKRSKETGKTRVACRSQVVPSNTVRQVRSGRHAGTCCTPGPGGFSSVLTPACHVR